MKKVNTFLIGYGTLVAVMVVAFISKLIYGIDITDEGYHLVSIVDPFEYPETTSYFGFVFHPIYKLLGGDFVLLRIVFWSSLYLISVYFFYSLITLDRNDALSNEKQRTSYGFAFVISAALAFSIFSNLQFWLPTPNYYSLTLCGIVIFALGIIIFAKGKEASFLSSGLLVGLSGALTFLAKPTSAAAIALVYVFFMISLINQVKYKKLILSAGIAILTSITVLIVFAFYSSGSIEVYINNLQQGLAFGDILLGKRFSSIESLIWRGSIDGFYGIIDNVIIFVVMSFLLGFWCYVSERNIVLRKTTIKHKAFFWFSLVVFASLFLYAIYSFFYKNTLMYLTSSNLDRILFLWGPLLLIALFICCLRFLKKQLSLRKVILSCCLLVLPYCYTFGTNHNYFMIITFASIFIPAAVVVLGNQSRSQEWLVYLSLYVISTTMLVIPPVVGEMYRQPNALRSAPDLLVKIDQGPLKNIIVVDYVRQYFDTLKNKAESKGFQPGTPVLDFTGASSGTILAIGGKNVASAWMIGGYDGSNNAAKFRLAAIDSEEIRRSWILTEEWYRQIDHSILENFGLSFENDYEFVAEVTIPSPLGGRGSSRPQKLYKPKM